jgi:proteic killer suppression protein
MIVRFKTQYLQKLFEQGEISGKPKYNEEVLQKFRKTVLKLQYADNILDIKSLKSLNFEALKGKVKGLYSVRVDLKYRLLFRIEKDGIIAEGIILIEELSNHY